MSPPAPLSLLDVFKARPDAARPLIGYHEVLLRGPSALTVAERELIAAYVSGLNACGYCRGVHAATAQAFGVETTLLQALIDDPDRAGIDDRLRPVFRFVRKLTLTPARVVEADRAAIMAAGWPVSALDDIAAICGLFNLMNRIVDGLGVELDPGYAQTSARRLHDVGYSGLLALQCH
jgi:uncharacterized peroxidase-related enzyme